MCRIKGLLEEITYDEVQQGFGTWTCSSDMGCGKRARVDDECLSVTKQPKICYHSELPG